MKRNDEEFEKVCSEEAADGATVVTASSAGIARSNRMFIQLAAMGECDDKGKTIFAMRGFKKVVAEADKPITTCILPLLHVLLERSHLSTPDAMEVELNALKAFVAQLEVKR